MAYQVALKNNIPNPLQKEAAGRTWFKIFEVTSNAVHIRTAHAASSARAKGFLLENVKQFFDVYKPEFDKVKRQPYRIYNMEYV